MAKTRKYLRIASSIRFRIVLIYVLLIFIAMTLLGTFIVRQLEGYYMNTISSNIEMFAKKSSKLPYTLAEYDSLSENQAEIQALIAEWGKTLQEEIFVIDDNFIIIATKDGSHVGQAAVDNLDENVIIRTLNGEECEENGYLTRTGRPVKSKTYPIGSEDDYKGVLYFRADLTSIYDTVTKTKNLFIQAMVMAIVATGILGFFIAGSITTPINTLRKKAGDMAKGDFTQLAEVKSEDEIGRLTEMFNTMQKRLGSSMSAMLNEKNKLEAILKYMADGLIAVDLSGKIIHANDMAMQMLSLDVHKLDYVSYYEITMEKYCADLTLTQIKEKENMEGNVVFEYGGSIFYARYGKFEDEKNRDMGIIVVIQDITQRQKLEDMQMDFVANVSHELKTPLTTIKSYIETIIETLMDGEKITDTVTLKNFLGVVDREAERMSRLVKDLLQLSRLDYKKEVLSRQKYSVTEIVEDAVTQIEINAFNKGQHLNVIFDSQSKIYAYVDRDRIEQVLINILSNAIKYTAEKGRVDVDVRSEGENVSIAVIDNGIGIPAGDLPRLFERFYRVDKARSRQMGGTGLGLAIAKQLVEAHGGSISVDSKEGKGTKVTIILPKESEDIAE